jgi:small subunit ribosomal protein S11
MTNKMTQKQAAKDSNLAVKPEKTEKTQEAERPVVHHPSAADLLSLETVDVKVHRAKGSKNIHRAFFYVKASFNNTHITVTGPDGAVIAGSSAGKVGFKGSRKSTAYAAQVAMQEAAKIAMSHGVREVDVRIKGAGQGREAAVRALSALSITVLSIKDITPVAHGGCRPKKQRRV